MKEKIFLPVIIGTNRDKRQSIKVAEWLHNLLLKKDKVETKLIDVADFKLPQKGYGQDIKDEFSQYQSTIKKADGLVLVVPEYNHGYPGILKSVLDLLLPEYIHKAVGLVGVSKGSFGGSRVIEALLPVVRELGMIVSFTDLNVSRVEKTFDQQGNLQDDKFIARADKFFTELIWLAQVLKYGRSQMPTKYEKKD